MSLEKRVKEFLLSNWDGKSPLLLAYSGGPDSKALLYALLEAGCSTLHIAHVDHGWRPESADEALQIEKEISSLHLPFFMTRLSPCPHGNLEDYARKQRYAFFESLFVHTPFQALLTGHQAEDLAETILKRLFEGAHLVSLKGMQAASRLGRVPLWRPLLHTRKKAILAFLQARSLAPLHDPTNDDPAYLRARMRRETIPYLNKSFGKEIVDNLALLSERACELEEYLDAKIQGVPTLQGAWGWAVCCENLHRVERRHLLQRAAAANGLTLPRTVLEPLLTFKGGRKIFFQSTWFIVYRGWITALKENHYETDYKQLIEERDNLIPFCY